MVTDSFRSTPATSVHHILVSIWKHSYSFSCCVCAVYPSVPSIFWATHSPALIPQQAHSPWDRIRDRSPTLAVARGYLFCVPACPYADVCARGDSPERNGQWARAMREYKWMGQKDTERERGWGVGGINHRSTMCQAKDKNVSRSPAGADSKSPMRGMHGWTVKRRVLHKRCPTKPKI